MRHVKVVLPAKAPEGSSVLGMDAKLFDAQTGEELDSLGLLELRCPMDGVITVRAEFLVSEIETR